MNTDELFKFDTQAKALLETPTVRLAHIDGAQGDCTLKGEKGVPQIGPASAPALLVSYYYLRPFLNQQHRYRYRDWVLDSGAFSAHNSGKAIDLNEYIDCCLRLLANDPTLTEVFALDMIPASDKLDDVKRAADVSIANCEKMWEQKVPAIPCYHRGEDESHLYHMAKKYPKIALGGVALLRGDDKINWLRQCFARVWPKRIHGFGMSGEEIVYALPFHSVDATNWELAPCAFGSWQRFGSMSVRGSNQDLRSQVKHYLELEAKARVRWAKQMAELEALPDEYPPTRPGPTVRLVANGCGGRDDAKALAFGNPTIRLAVDAGAASGLHAANAFGKRDDSGNLVGDKIQHHKECRCKECQATQAATEQKEEKEKPAAAPKPKKEPKVAKKSTELADIDSKWANWRG